MIRKLAFLGVILLLCALPLKAQGTSDPRIVTLAHGGYERSYILYVPAEVQSPAPLVIALHGAGGVGAEMLAYSGLTELADSVGFVVAFPDGIQQGWNYLEADQLHPSDLYTDDLGFLRVLIPHVGQQVPIDEDRVYIIGFSNGGLLALRAGCSLQDTVAAVAIYGANFRERLVEHCLNAKPYPFLFVLGMRDEAFPWAGEVWFNASGDFRSTFSMQQTLTLLTSLNRCLRQGESQPVNLENAPIRVVRNSYSACADNSEIVLYGLVDFGHQWAGRMPIILPNGATGTINEAVWEFFQQHPRKAN